MTTFKHPHTLMVQGTTSDAGKSILVTALGRILSRHGIPVAPFKPQNMALNSAVTADGGEIGRAQAVQAEACGLAPTVEMNPVLLKPNSDVGAQVIVRGQAIGNMKARDYHHYKPRLLADVLTAHSTLQREYRVVLVEGAGSPAEINLREHDIANMGFAEAADCPVILVADIDRGGVFAHLYGTYQLLSDSERARVRGFVINRFRGDVSLLQSGLDWLEAETGVPVLGVVPYLHDLHIEAEDALNATQPIFPDDGDYRRLKVAVPIYPRASNHTDFDALRLHPRVDCRFYRESRDFQGADLIVLPGSKNVRGDLAWLRRTGWDRVLQRHLRLGGKAIGICGGYQLLGHSIEDPDGVESTPGESPGLGLLAIRTRLTGSKTLRRVQGRWRDDGTAVSGYEIHTGVSEGAALERPLFELRPQFSTGEPAYPEGTVSDDDTVLGTYLHGLFDDPATLERLLGWAGEGAGFDPAFESFDYRKRRADEFDRLADAVETAIPVERWCRLLSLEPPQ